LVGPSLRDPAFRAENSAEDIFGTINLGHEATPMIGWGEILTARQIQELVDFILQFKIDEAGPKEGATPTPGAVSFASDIMPILEARCNACHGSMGGWDGTTYQSVIESGNNGPAVIPGDVENSLLAQKLLGTHQKGTIMPPTGKMSETEIQPIRDWIAGGAPEN
jgi:hypothetical protein